MISTRLTNVIAAALLIWVFLAALFSMSGDSLTMDELAHLPAGYSYLTQKDMRLNPEHPPLIKDLSAFPLLFIKNINFPSDIKAWQEDVNGQWDFGNYFLFKSGNPADALIFWGRVPMILLLLLLGFYIFKFAKEFFGNKAALIALLLFSFSPTLLAHGRLVTTDVGAAFGAIFATYYFLKALENPTKKSIIFAGLALGTAELLKFSLILLIPFFVLLTLIRWKGFKVLAFVFILGFVLVGAVYQYHVWNYPLERQVADSKSILGSFPNRPIADSIIWLADKPILRAYAQYGLGLAMVTQRASGGNTTYFLGEVSASGWKNYFPLVYLLKEPLTFHILTLLALIFAVWQIKKFRIGQHFPVLVMLLFIGIYWATSLKSNLNIGVRHLLPVFPFTIILVSAAVAKIKPVILAGLAAWQIISVVSVYPSFLAYFNESIGGPSQGYKYAVDSNLDWGQDLKRLTKWVEENNISEISVDYFGGADISYYLKEKLAPWQGHGYLAVSATFLQGGRGRPADGFNSPTGYYNWLNSYTPVAQIGNSIFVYKID